MKLYKKDTSGKIRYLSVYAEGEELVQKSGVVGGKEIEARKVCKAKNVGRSNATTPSVQAIREAEALITDKLTKGYFRSIEELSSSDDILLPMLAKDFTKEEKKVDWNNCYVQPKFDGMRALIKVKDGVVSIWSRQGKEIITVPHIVKSIAEWVCNSSTCLATSFTLDGELYAHGFSFQENMELIKKFREGKTDKFVRFNCYDVVQPLGFSDRYFGFWRNRSTPNFVDLVTTQEVKGKEDLVALHTTNLSIGYEGTIVRWGNEGYKPNGRSSNLLKYKDFLDLTAVIIDVEPSDARPTQGVMVCENGNGERFKASLKFSFEERERILREKDSYIGQTAEIRFFEYTDSGLPRFPVCVGFRLDK